MNKAEIIKAVAQSTGLTQKAVGEVIDGMIETIKESARKGEPVRFSGLFNKGACGQRMQSENGCFYGRSLSDGRIKNHQKLRLQGIGI